jgi:hypothetical protein
VRIPTHEEYVSYDGAHCSNLWRSLPPDWCCPACKRTAFEIMRWTKRSPNKCVPFWGWLAGLHEHHDHSDTERFKRVVICDQCNAADGLVKRRYRGIIPDWWSFSPEQIGQFVTARPHDRHIIDFEMALAIWQAATA